MSKTTDPATTAAVAEALLAGALLAGVDGGYLSDQAATRLIAEHGHWLTNKPFGLCIQTDPELPGRAWIEWHDVAKLLDDKAADFYENRRIVCSGSQRAILEIACSLGNGRRIDLRDVLGNLDDTNLRRVLAAIATANGTRGVSIA